METSRSYTVFDGMNQVVSGQRATVEAAVKALITGGAPHPVLIFDDLTGEQIDADFRFVDGAESPIAVPCETGPSTEPAEEKRRSPGRPKLGVVGREITLLPRHWDWLNTQPGGASVALRKLVDKARRENERQDRRRRSQEAAYRFLNAVHGDAPGFEDAIRALFAGDRAAFDAQTRGWPRDISRYAGTLAAAAFDDPAAQTWTGERP